jgi:hypothetical protein
MFKGASLLRKAEAAKEAAAAGPKPPSALSAYLKRYESGARPRAPDS